MRQETVSRDKLIKRLKRVEGQVRGVQKMIEEERDCESVLTQLAAVRSAVDGVGALVLNNYMEICFRDKSRSDLDQVDSLARAVAIWGRIRVGDGR